MDASLAPTMALSAGTTRHSATLVEETQTYRKESKPSNEWSEEMTEIWSLQGDTLALIWRAAAASLCAPSECHLHDNGVSAGRVPSDA